ncbi:MAG: DUF6895 family protein [bacterium]
MKTNKICILIIVVSFILFSCNSISNKSTPPAPEKVEKAIQNALQWIENHPESFTDGQFLEISEGIVMFYVLYKHCKSRPHAYFREQIQKRLELLASNPAYKITPQDYTIFLAISYIMKKLDLPLLDYDTIIKEVMLEDPLLYPSYHITTCIWNHVFLERLGYTPQNSFDELISQSTFSKEFIYRRLLKALQGKFDKRSIDHIGLTIYNITHEIFCLTDFGEISPSVEILITQKDFYSKLFEESLKWAIKAKHIDLLGEIIMCGKILNMEESLPSLPRAINFILSSQESDGSFGITNPSRANAFRHGIMVVLMALCM